MPEPLDFKMQIMLDSGAFSAWRLGTTIDLQKYIAFIKRNRKFIDTYVTLDVIPGANMIIDTSQAAVDNSAAQSYKNHQIMKDAGLTPIPVFHQGENFRWLEKYLDDGEPYIGISPYSKSHRLEIVRWMDDCFTLCTDRKGNPVVKTHGFGVTAPMIVNRYPWWSVDSISWAITGGYGMCMVPTLRRDGTLDYVDVKRVHLSSRMDKITKTTFDKMGPVMTEKVLEVFGAGGMTMGELRNSSFGRTVHNLRYFQGLQAQCTHMPFEHRAESLMHDHAKVRKSKGTLPLHIIFAAKAQVFVRNMLLNQMKIGHRLYSYHEMRQFPDEAMELLYTTGLPGVRKQKRATGNKNNEWGERYRIFRVSKLAEKLGEKPWGQGKASE